MQNTLKITVSDGTRVIDLTNNGYLVTDVSGLGTETELHTSAYAAIAGSFYHGHRVPSRQISILYVIVDTHERTVQKQKAVDTMCADGKEITMHWVCGADDYSIKGVISKITPYTHKEPFSAQIILDCMYPYFYKTQDFCSTVLGLRKCLKFPLSISQEKPLICGSYYTSPIFSIVNDGVHDTGFVVKIKVLAPFSNLSFENVTTREKFTINKEFATGDVIIVTTRGVTRSVILTRDNEETNLFGYVDGDLFLLQHGKNYLKIDSSVGASAEHMQVDFVFNSEYQSI